MAIFARVIAGFFLVCILSKGAIAEKRVALVIGNSTYPSAPLNNPSNDADDLSAALKRLQFDVTEHKDLTTRAFDDAVDEFVVQAKDADVALFFFSGHGVQIDKRAYIAPVDIRAETESTALRELMSIQDVVSRIEHAAKVSVVVLDACRDSPLQERLRRVAMEKNKALSPTKGLPPISVIGSNTLIVYATVPGEVASDGTGRNSPFTTALLKHLETPGLEMELMFKRVTTDVLKNTGGAQQPERLSRLQSELILLEDTAQRQLWDSVKDSADPDIVDTYLSKYPTGIFADVARAHIKQIEQQRLLDQALKEERKRRDEAEKREAEVRKLEESLKAREAALAEERRRSEEARALQEEEKRRQETPGKGSGAPQPEEQSKQNEASLQEENRGAEELRRDEELRQAKEEARIAKEAVAAAEKRRQAEEKAAAEARRKSERVTIETSRRNPTRPDPLGVSSRIWANGTIREGDLVSKVTEWGRLVCIGGNNKTGKPRLCHWE